MLPDDPRHGTYAGSIQHYIEKSETCRPCKDAAATYRRNLRTRRYLARGPLEVPARGTIRRIYALCAIGYHMREIDQALGKQYGYVSQLKRYPVVHRSTAVAIAELYERWSGTVPPETPLRSRQRKIAAARGWAPPLAWDDIDTDPDPVKTCSVDACTRRPHRRDMCDAHYRAFLRSTGNSRRLPIPIKPPREPETADRVIVDRLIAGEPVPSNRAEKIEAMRRWVAAGRSERSLCAIHGWKYGRYKIREDGAA